MQNVLALKKICISSCFPPSFCFLILSLHFLLNFPSHSNFNSSFPHQFLTSWLKSPIFVSLLFIIPFLFLYLVLSTPSLILPSFISGLFHKLLLLSFTLSCSLFGGSFFPLSYVVLHSEFPISFPYNFSFTYSISSQCHDLCII